MSSQEKIELLYFKKPTGVSVRGPLVASEMVTTAHGRVRAEAGDFIVTDPRNRDTWPIKPDFFAENYAPFAPSEREKAREAIIQAALEDKCPQAHSANLTYALDAYRALGDA